MKKRGFTFCNLAFEIFETTLLKSFCKASTLEPATLYLYQSWSAQNMNTSELYVRRQALLLSAMEIVNANVMQKRCCRTTYFRVPILLL